ncbi:hypothetical protein BH24CHL9_BH24CHL9_16540 [soil metagenome]
MEPVCAYIDPGSGSLLIQALIATLVAVPIFFRQQISRAIRAVRGTSTDAGAASPQGEDPTPRA